MTANSSCNREPPAFPPTTRRMLYSPRPSESLDGQTSFPSGSWAVDGASGASQNRMLHFQLTFNSSYRDLKPSPGLSSTEDELLHEPSKGGETRLQLPPHSRGRSSRLRRPSQGPNLRQSGCASWISKPAQDCAGGERSWYHLLCRCRRRPSTRCRERCSV